MWFEMFYAYQLYISTVQALSRHVWVFTLEVMWEGLFCLVYSVPVFFFLDVGDALLTCDVVFSLFEICSIWEFLKILFWPYVSVKNC